MKRGHSNNADINGAINLRHLQLAGEKDGWDKGLKISWILMFVAWLLQFIAWLILYLKMG